jgi:hypothetical protein
MRRLYPQTHFSGAAGEKERRERGGEYAGSCRGGGEQAGHSAKAGGQRPEALGEGLRDRGDLEEQPTR